MDPHRHQRHFSGARGLSLLLCALLSVPWEPAAGLRGRTDTQTLAPLLKAAARVLTAHNAGRKLEPLDALCRRLKLTPGQMYLVQELLFTAPAPGQQYYFTEYERDHTIKVTLVAMWIAERMHLDADTQRLLLLGALFHDIGKAAKAFHETLGPEHKDHIGRVNLNQPPSLKLKRIHVLEGMRIFRSMIQGREYLFNDREIEAIRWAIQFHHYYRDDSAVPESRRGYTGIHGSLLPPAFGDIPAWVHIITVADQFDAATNTRRAFYGKTKTVLTFVLDTFRNSRNGGMIFEPLVADAFGLLVWDFGETLPDIVQTQTDQFYLAMGFYEPVLQRSA